MAARRSTALCGPMGAVDSVSEDATRAGATAHEAQALALADPIRAAQVLRQWCPGKAEDAAILLLSLGEQAASGMFARLEPFEVAKLGTAMLGAAVVPRDRVQRVARAFVKAIGRLVLLAPDPADFVRRALAQAFGEREAQRRIVAVLAQSALSVKALLHALPEQALAALIEQEHRQVGAMMLALLEPERSLAVAKRLTQELALDLVSRLARMQPVSADALADLHAGLAAALQTGDAGADLGLSGPAAAGLIASGLHPNGLPAVWRDALHR